MSGEITGIKLLNEDTIHHIDYEYLANKPAIPTKTSDLVNDAGFLNEHDVIEGYMYSGVMYTQSTHVTPIIGETGKIYIDLTTDTTYRWSGSSWVSISNPVEMATSQEAVTGTNNTKMMTPLRVRQAIEAALEEWESRFNASVSNANLSLTGNAVNVNGTNLIINSDSASVSGTNLNL